MSLAAVAAAAVALIVGVGGTSASAHTCVGVAPNGGPVQVNNPINNHPIYTSPDVWVTSVSDCQMWVAELFAPHH